MPNGRCRVHGGMSTGAKTPEGKARAIAAMVEGRRKYVERLKAEGMPFPWGAKRKIDRPNENERKAALVRKELLKESAGRNRARANSRPFRRALKAQEKRPS
jgi:hypothetical protein